MNTESVAFKSLSSIAQFLSVETLAKAHDILHDNSSTKIGSVSNKAKEMQWILEGKFTVSKKFSNYVACIEFLSKHCENLSVKP